MVDNSDFCPVLIISYFSLERVTTKHFKNTNTNRKKNPHCVYQNLISEQIIAKQGIKFTNVNKTQFICELQQTLIILFIEVTVFSQNQIQLILMLYQVASEMRQ